MPNIILSDTSASISELKKSDGDGQCRRRLPGRDSEP
jgi:hypothetical protein